MRRYLDAQVIPLTDGWRAATAPGSTTGPAKLNGNGDGSLSRSREDAPALDWVPASVPGTLAAALTAAGRFDPARPHPLQDTDAWYALDLDAPAGAAVLRFEGLATVAEVFLNDVPILATESMFEAFDVPVELTGADRLTIRFASLTGRLAAKGPRARWRPRLADDQGLRLVRTSLLGHMPGWCPSIQAVGPYRAISLIRPGSLALDDVLISADADAADGVLTVSFSGSPDGLRLRCAGGEASFDQFLPLALV